MGTKYLQKANEKDLEVFKMRSDYEQLNVQQQNLLTSDFEIAGKSFF